MKVEWLAVEPGTSQMLVQPLHRQTSRFMFLVTIIYLFFCKIGLLLLLLLCYMSVQNFLVHFAI